MATEEQILPIFGNIIAFFKKKKNDANKFTYFGYNLRKGARFVFSQQNNCTFMQSITKKSSNFTDFQRNKCNF